MISNFRGFPNQIGNAVHKDYGPGQNGRYEWDSSILLTHFTSSLASPCVLSVYSSGPSISTHLSAQARNLVRPGERLLTNKHSPGRPGAHLPARRS